MVIPVGVLASGLLFNFPLGVLLYWFTSNLWTLGQQAYIIRFHPHDRGARRSRSGELGKTLAPRPGQRPVRHDEAARPRTSASTRRRRGGTGRRRAPRRPARSVPRPGQRPNRPAGKRPPAEAPHPGQEAALSANRPGPTRGLTQERIHCCERDRRRQPTEADAATETDDVGRRDETDTETDARRTNATEAAPSGRRPARPEGDIAADYLERLLDIVDYDGDIDLDVENDRAAVAIVGSDLQSPGRRRAARRWTRCRS